MDPDTIWFTSDPDFILPKNVLGYSPAMEELKLGDGITAFKYLPVVIRVDETGELVAADEVGEIAPDVDRIMSRDQYSILDLLK